MAENTNGAKDVDCIVIGSGQGGTSLASSLAKDGKQVTLIERDRLGGSCVNYGCTPSKAMLAPAHAIGRARDAKALGVDVDVKPDFRRIMDRVRAVRGEWQEKIQKVRSVDKLEIIEAEGSFEGPDTVRAGDERRRSERIVINTGMSAAIPPIDGLEGTPFLTNDSIFDLEDLPPRLCVLGAGYVGLELGQAMARFGSEVTIVESGEQVLKREMRQVAHTLEKSLREEGIQFRMGRKATSVEHDGKTFRIAFDSGDAIEAEALLVATGRKPNTTSLHVERAGVELGERGAVKIDDRFETSREGVYAIGDCAGQPPFTHISSEDYRRLTAIWKADNERGGKVTGDELPRRRDDRVLAYAVFTDPSVGRVGLDEQQAHAAGHDAVAHRMPLAETSRGREWDMRCGYVEIVADRHTKRILGATFIGHEGSELAQLFLPLLENGLTVDAVGESIFVHPTFFEDVMMLARKFEGG